MCCCHERGSSQIHALQHYNCFCLSTTVFVSQLSKTYEYLGLSAALIYALFLIHVKEVGGTFLYSSWPAKCNKLIVIQPLVHSRPVARGINRISWSPGVNKLDPLGEKFDPVERVDLIQNSITSCMLSAFVWNVLWRCDMCAFSWAVTNSPLTLLIYSVTGLWVLDSSLISLTQTLNKS